MRRLRGRRSGWAVSLALLGLAGCCGTRSRCCAPPCGAARVSAGADAEARAPLGQGTLVVTSSLEGDVLLDGQPVGTTPFESRVATGSHEVRVRLGGFEEFVGTVRVAPGARSEVVADLVARDVEDRQVLQLLARKSALWMQPYEQPLLERGADAPVVVSVYPRSTLRLSDLRDLRIDFPVMPPAGEVRFRRGQDVLHVLAVDAKEAGAWIRPFPEDVRTTLFNGDVVTWGWYPKDGEPAEASFEVVAKDLGPTLAAIEANMKGQPASAAAYLRIQVLTDAGLPYGAMGEATQLIRQGQGAVRAWAAALDALERMGVPKTALAWKEAQARLSALSRAQQAEVFGGGDYATAKMLDQLRLGHAGRVLQSLDAERLSALAQSSVAARQMTAEAASHALRLAERSPASAKKLADTLLKMARSARDLAPQDPEARWALAQAQIAHARTLRATGVAVPPAAWREAAETLLSAYDLGAADEGRGFAQAAAWLREAAASASAAERGPLLEALAAVVVRAQERFPGTGATLATAAIHQLAKADAGTSKDAKAALLAGAQLLQALVAQESPDASAASAFADLVTLDRRRGLKTGLEYRTDSIVTTPDLARFRLPTAQRWVRDGDLPAGIIAWLEQRSPEGGVLRQITVRAVNWADDYEFPSGLTAGGKNTLLLAKHDLTEARRGLAKVKRAGDVVKQRFSRAFSKADAYEVSGIDHDGALRTVRGWVFPSEHSEVTYLVTVDEFKGAAEDDPEFALFRDSFEDVTPAAK